VVSVLAKVHRFKPSQGDGFLRMIKIHSTSTARGEVKLEAPCHKILRHVKELYEYERNSS
jgi:hypothetical protein